MEVGSKLLAAPIVINVGILGFLRFIICLEGHVIWKCLGFP